MVAIFIKSAKMAGLGILKTNVFSREGYDVIIYVHDFTKTFSHVIQFIL